MFRWRLEISFSCRLLLSAVLVASSFASCRSASMDLVAAASGGVSVRRSSSAEPIVFDCILFVYGKFRLKIMHSFSLLGFFSHWVFSMQGFNEAS